MQHLSIGSKFKRREVKILKCSSKLSGVGHTKRNGKRNLRRSVQCIGYEKVSLKNCVIV